MGANIARAMQNKHDRMRLLSEEVCYHIKTQLSFYVMDSRLSSNCTRNIHRPSSPDREVNRKENTVEKITKRRQNRKFTHVNIKILAKFYSITYCFAAKKIRIFRARFVAFPLVEFPKICWTVKHIFAPPSACS